MTVKEVSEQKFEAIMNKDIGLNRCPICGAAGEIVVNIPWYGQRGAKVRCSKCECSTKFFNIHSYYQCSGRYGTPILDKSIMRGIRAAIQSWNSGNNNIEQKGGEG